LGQSGAGTLYAGDGVVIQQPYQGADCAAVLRYPRSTFGSGNISFLWARFGTDSSSSQFPSEGRSASAQHGASYEFGRITIAQSHDGSLKPVDDSSGVFVTEDEVVVSVLINPDSPVMTLYAVHVTKIAPHETNFKTKLFPMQPNRFRSRPLTIAPHTPTTEAGIPTENHQTTAEHDATTAAEIPTTSIHSEDHHTTAPPATTAPHSLQWLSSQPLDFSCTEFDLSESYGTRAVLTAVSTGSMDGMLSFMYSYYPERVDFSAPVSRDHTAPICGPGHPPCLSYYANGLRRQFSESSDFQSFRAILGGATIASSPGFHLVCVSASAADARFVKQDGDMMLQYQKKDQKNFASECSNP